MKRTLLVLLVTTSITLAQTNIGITTTGGPSPCGNGNGTDANNANLLCGVQVNVPTLCAAQSLSFFVTAPAGSLVLSIYDATGTGGMPGRLIAQTNAFATVANWNTQSLQNPVALQPGTYWLCYNPSSNNLGSAIQSGGTGFFTNLPYSASMPGFAPAGQMLNQCVWSIYATVAPATPLAPGNYVLPNGSSVIVP